MKEERFLALAKKVSKRSDHHEHKLGCAIVRGSKVLGLGFNLLKTHTHSPHRWKGIHAEYMAVMAASYDVKGATAYIFRQQKNGTPAMSRPCQYCWKLLMECGIKKVVYTFEGSFKEERVA